MCCRFNECKFVKRQLFSVFWIKPNRKQGLEWLMIIWNIGETVTRTEIEKHLSKDGNVVPSTILTLLSRLTERGFLQTSKQGKTNYYTPLIAKKDYQSGDV